MKFLIIVPLIKQSYHGDAGGHDPALCGSYYLGYVCSENGQKGKKRKKGVLRLTFKRAYGII